MKQSQFNLFFEDKGTSRFVIFNAKSTALAVISEKEMELYKKLFSSNFEYTNQEEKNFLQELKKGQFVFDDNENEIEVLKYLQKSSQFSKNSLSLTIAPTMACNFGCVYCYQGEHNEAKKMSKDVQESIVKFVKSRIRKINHLSITWYGGEPLLAIDVIENLTNEFLKLCKENNVSYYSSIITNGYFFTKEVAQKLRDFNVSTVQITIDGPKEYHDSKRPLKNGGGTFDTIIANLIATKGIFPNKISLRINTDQYNQDKVKDVIEILKQNNLENDVYPYLGHVDATNDFYDDEKCLTTEKFADIRESFQKEMCCEQSAMAEYPRAKFNACLADSEGYVVDPNGDLTKCWCDIGHDEYCIGNIMKGDTKFKRLIEYFNYDVFSDPKCKNCSIIPICMGGCPRRRIDKGHTICASAKKMINNNVVAAAKEKDKTLESMEPIQMNFGIVNG